MEDSKRLRDQVDRTAAKSAAKVERAPFHPIAAEVAKLHGVDLSKVDPAEGDRLLEQAEQRARQERLARQADILLRRLPGQYRDATIPKTPFGLKAYQWVREYREGSRKSLVILGPTGTGKTWVLCAIARLLLVEDSIPVTITTSAEFLDSLRPGSEGMDVDMLQFSLAPVLGLDDLGMEKLTDWGAEQLYRLAHERSHNGRPTIVTSNLDGNAIKERYDRRTVERLFAGAELIMLDGPTLRPMPF